jgi:hypothetical protein
MAEFSAPFDGTPITTQTQWSGMAKRWGLDGVHGVDGTNNSLAVTAAGTTTVAVAPGRASVNGYYYHNNTIKNLTVPANAGGTARIDLVILRADPTAKTVTAVYKTGGTSAPSLTQNDDGTWEIPLAQCTVAAGASVVIAANVVDKRWFTDRGALPSSGPNARPPSVKNQLMTENGKLYVGDGAGWNWLATQGVDDDTYTPAWTAGTTTINWGSGSTNIGRYQAVGRRVDVTIQLIPTGNPPAYTDPIGVALPPNLPCTATFRSMFTWNFTSANGEGSAVGIGFTFPTTDGTGKIARLRYGVSDGVSVNSTVNSINLLTNQPFNIRAGDVLTIDGSYWLA